MPKLIDADKLKEHYAWWDNEDKKIFDTIIDLQPTVDAEPVQLKHGHWIKDDTGAEYCSNCHEYPYDDGEYHITNWHSNYCPNCGAKMDEDSNTHNTDSTC